MNREFELYLATHCAPVLCGRKPAALFSERKLPENCVWVSVRRRGLHMLKLPWRDNALTLLYDPVPLVAALDEGAARQRLAALGYPVERGLRAQLAFLRKRFLEAADFPHEVGFFLGYPAQDVIGFMECGDCKLCGAWKVFGDAKHAAALFEEYARCRSVLLAHIGSGGSIFNADLPALAG